MVGVQGFEPWTPCSQSRCATRLRYTPTESIFYTEMAQWGKSCKIRGMGALFSSKYRKQFRGFIALSLLLVCLLGTHWIGLTHGIAHSGLSGQSLELSSSDQSVGNGHGSSSCHLFDALTLASFISPSNYFEINQTVFSKAISVASTFKPALTDAGPYQSRAPPAFHI